MWIHVAKCGVYLYDIKHVELFKRFLHVYFIEFLNKKRKKMG